MQVPPLYLCSPMRAVCTILFALFALSACKKEKVQNFQVYKGPLLLAENIKTVYSDSARTRIVMEAPVQNEFANGNRTFPKGIVIHFYNPQGKPESRLTANKGYYSKMTEIYTGQGNVVVQNLKEAKTLRTEELKWSRFEKRVYTDKFVRIETPEETYLGDGLTAAQDFSTYKILKLRATIPVSKL